MIWILLFALLFSNNESTVVINNIDKYAKKYVLDKNKSKEFIILINENRNHRKTFVKQQEVNLNELKKLAHSRNTTREDFDKVIDEILNARRQMQVFDTELKTLTPDYVTENEWSIIVAKSKSDLDKTIKKKEKRLNKIKRKYDKFESDIASIIKDDARRSEVGDVFAKFEDVVVKKLDNYEAYLRDDSSLVYQYKTSSKEMVKLANTINEGRAETFKIFVDTYFAILNLTTEEEWHQLSKELKKVY